MAKTDAEKRMEQLEAAISEARRFQAAAEAALKRLRCDPSAAWCCSELAAVKRASMDLTKALPPLRTAV